MDMLKNAVDSVQEAVSDAADTVKEAVKDTGMSAILTIAEKELTERLGYDMKVDSDDIPDNWKEWVMKTGVNSLLNDSTWDFLEDSQSNKRKVELWKERDIKKIVLTVQEECDNDDRWIVANVSYDSDVMTVKFLPHAKDWKSESLWSGESGRRWWILRDEIVFGLQLYQLPGLCFYKSDYLEMEDTDGDYMSSKYKRWFQFRHWVIFWFGRARWGWNYQWTKTPPPNADGSNFSLDSVLSLPDMPELKMPSLTLPSLPDIEMPSCPDMPSISAPSISAPSVDLSNVSMPSVPEKPQRPTAKWALHGIIELKDLNVIAKGKKLVFSNATITHFWQKGNTVKDEKKEHSKLECECSDAEQAKSWVDSLKESGVKEGEVGGCCVIA